jgi:hypothetical protein
MPNESRVAVNDILVVYHSFKRKNVLVRLVKIDADGLLQLVVADDTAAFVNTEERFSASFSSVLAVLGPEPPCYGSAYSVLLHPFYERTSVKGWGEIMWMLPTTDEMVAEAHRQLQEFLFYIKEDRLHRFAYLTKMQQIDPSNSKIRGFYNFRSKQADDTITYILDEFATLTLHLVGHEYAHGLWYRVMTDAKRADWIDLYSQSVLIDSISDNKIKPVLGDFAALKGKGAIKEMFKELKKDNNYEALAICKAVIKAIKEEHCLDRFDIDSLLTANRSLKKYMPTLYMVRKGYAATGVSNYADKKAIEFFPESFAAFYASEGTRDALPDSVYNEMLTTLKTLQASR